MNVLALNFKQYKTPNATVKSLIFFPFGRLYKTTFFCGIAVIWFDLIIWRALVYVTHSKSIYVAEYEKKQHVQCVYSNANWWLLNHSFFSGRRKGIQYQRAKCRRIVNHSSTIFEVDERTKNKTQMDRNTQKKCKIIQYCIKNVLKFIPIDTLNNSSVT